jgi:D-tyrosyl-tRNA(Tyr) deacylase
MIALIQRVSRAAVRVETRLVGEIGRGLLVFVCAERGDSPSEAENVLSKVLKMRVFSDDEGKMNRSVQDVGGGLLIVSHFTLAADTSGGNRPSFGAAAAPADGLALYEHFIAAARTLHPVVQTGEFAAMMQVELVNDGPVTIPLRVQPHVPAH